MIPFRKIALLATLVCSSLFVFTSCNNDDDDPTPSDSGLDCEYLQARLGSSWTYEGSLAYSTEIVGDTTINGETILISRDDYPNSAEDGRSFVGCMDDGIIATAPEISNGFTTFEAPLILSIFLDRPLNESWEAGQLTSTTNGITTTTTYEASILEKDLDVTVSGTTYSDVIRVEMLVVVTGSAFPNPIDGGKVEYFLAPKVGNIRTIFYSPDQSGGYTETSRANLKEYIY